MSVLVTLHVLGAVLFVGNIITAAFWKLLAERRGELGGVLAAARNVMIADYLFTLPGIVLLLVTGHLLMLRSGYGLLHLNWLSVAYAGFLLSGLLWLAVLLPAQRRMMREAAASLEHGSLTRAYRRASSTWNQWGTLATLVPLAVLYLMTAKPF